MSRAYTNLKDDMGSLSHLKSPRKVLPTHLNDDASCKSSVTHRKKHFLFVFIWSQSKLTSSPQPSFPASAWWLQSNPQLFLKAIFGPEEMALVLHAVVKADQMVHLQSTMLTNEPSMVVPQQQWQN